jgi:hypothetical protein
MRLDDMVSLLMVRNQVVALQTKEAHSWATGRWLSRPPRDPDFP